MTKQVFHVPAMHCTACVMLLEGLEDELNGVKQVTASYQKQRLEVEYDETLVTEQQIIEAVKELGYEAIPLT